MPHQEIILYFRNPCYLLMSEYENVDWSLIRKYSHMREYYKVSGSNWGHRLVDLNYWNIDFSTNYRSTRHFLRHTILEWEKDILVHNQKKVKDLENIRKGGLTF